MLSLGACDSNQEMLKQQQIASQLLRVPERKTFIFKQVNFRRQFWDMISCKKPLG